MKVAREPSQAMQRVKVGMIGLAAVVLLIALASAIIGSATRERPIATAGSAQADVVAKIALTNSTSPSTGEPLAELGIAPSASNSQLAARR
jgi:cobalamin synthase